MAKDRNIAQNLIQLLATFRDIYYPLLMPKLFAFDCKDYETNMKFP
jgi:hypothetical protein